MVSQSNSKYEKTLTAAVNLDNLVLPIDPINNPTLTNAFFSNNLYSNIIEVDEQNRYVPDLASNYWFDKKNSKIVFDFKNSRASAQDAAFSLKRVILQDNLHSDLWLLICKEGENREQCASRIIAEDTLLTIKYSSIEKSTYIIPTLASVDFKIVPTSAFDTNDPATAKIVDYTKTTGHYHLVTEGTKFIFKKNSLSTLNVYKKIELVNLTYGLISDEKNYPQIAETDVISTTVPINQKFHEYLARNGWNTFSSHNISIGLIVFSKKGLKKTTAEQRFLISKLVTEEMKKNSLYGSHPTIEFYQDFGQGYLNTSQKKEIQELRDYSSELGAKLSVNLGVRTPSKWESFANNNPNIQLRKINGLGTTLPEDEQPDLFILTNDVSFDLNLSLFAYAAKTGLIELSSQELEDFLKLESAEGKGNFINKIHFRSLKNCQIYPMWASPYFTLLRKNFDNNLSKFNSRTLLWKIH